MLRAGLVAFFVLLAGAAVPSASAASAAGSAGQAAAAAASADDLSAARHKAKRKAKPRKSQHRHRAYRGRAAPATRRTGHDVCRGDAIRLCRPVLGQGNMAVLGCFKARQARLSRGCRALLVGYGQL